ncbi:hypothetical protein SCA6_005844 [Theobroma cacao]
MYFGEEIEHTTPMDTVAEQISAGQETSKSQRSFFLKRKHNLRDGLYPSKMERTLSELMGETFYCPDIENGTDGIANRLPSSSSGKKRKAVDSFDDSVVLEGRKTISLAKVSSTTSHSPKPSFKIGECIRRATSPMTGSPLIPKGKLDGGSENPAADGYDFPFDNSEDAQRKRMNVTTEYSSLDELLPQLHLAASEPITSYSSFNNFISFFSDFRDSLVVDQLPGDKAGGKRKKSPNSIFGPPGTFEFEDMNDTYWTDRIVQNRSEEHPLHGNGRGQYQIVPVELKKPLQKGRKSRKRYSDVNHDLTAEKPPGCVDERAPAELVMNFSEITSVPSETKLNKMFKHFGPLKESETEVDRETCCARVVFRRSSDAEVAYNSAGKFNIFGSVAVNYQLTYTISESFNCEQFSTVVTTISEQTSTVATTMGEEDSFIATTLSKETSTITTTLGEETSMVNISLETPSILTTLDEETPSVLPTLAEETTSVPTTLGEETPFYPVTLAEETPIIPITLGQETPDLRTTLGEETPVIPPTLGEETPAIPPTFSDETSTIIATLGKETPTIPTTMGEETTTVPATLVEETTTIPTTLHEETLAVPTTLAEETPTIPTTLGEETATIPTTLGEETANIPKTLEEIPTTPTTVTEETSTIPTTLGLEASTVLTATGEETSTVSTTMGMETLPPAVAEGENTSLSSDVDAANMCFLNVLKQPQKILTIVGVMLKLETILPFLQYPLRFVREAVKTTGFRKRVLCLVGEDITNQIPVHGDRCLATTSKSRKRLQYSRRSMYQKSLTVSVEDEEHHPTQSRLKGV